MPPEERIIFRENLLLGEAPVTSAQAAFQVEVGASTIVSDYISLVKPRIVVMNLFSALVGLALAVGTAIPLCTASFLLISGVFVASGCGTLGSYYDRDIDRLMKRTSGRPLPSGRMSPRKALYAGIFMIPAGLIVAVIWLNLLTTFLIAIGAAIFISYTIWLKRRTPWSVVIGGLSGSCAVLAGFAAATGGIALPAILICILVFLWTPGHFWSLSIWSRDDYERAKVPTLSVVHGEKATAKYIIISNIALILFTVISYLLGIFGEIYLIASLALGLLIFAENVKLYSEPTGERAWRAFKLSSPYLGIVYVAILIDVFLRGV